MSTNEMPSRLDNRGRPDVNLDPNLLEFARKLLLVALFIAVGLLLWYALNMLLLAFAGILLAVFLTTLSHWVSQRTGLRYGWSLAIVIVVLLGLLALFGWLLASTLGQQVQELQQTLPQTFHTLQHDLNETTWGRAILQQSQQGNLFDLGGAVNHVSNALTLTLSALVYLAVIVFVGFYGALEPGLYRKGFLYLFPASQRDRMHEVLDAVTETLRGWLLGQLLVMVITGVLVTVGLWILGVKLFLGLGVTAFVLEVIPDVGPFLFAIPGILLALAESPQKGIEVAILYAVVQGIESNVLVPLIQRQTVWLPPVLTILMQVLFGWWAGILGLFLAAPLTAVGLVVVRKLYVRDTLQTEVRVPGASGNNKTPAETASG